jgi:hypothetical protein
MSERDLVMEDSAIARGEPVVVKMFGSVKKLLLGESP